MASLDEMFQLETKTGEPVTVHGVTVTPQAQALSVRISKFGGLVWNRPVGVLVERDGQTKRMPVINVNRWATIGLVTLAAAVALLTVILSQSNKETPDE